MSLNGYIKYSPYEKQHRLREYFECYLVGNGACYILSSVPDSIVNGYSTLLNKLKIPFSNDLDNFRNKLITTDEKSFAVYPDSTLKQLKSRKIEYAIYSSLRLDPQKKDGRTQSTTEGTVNYVNTRYPGFYEAVIKFGEDNDEPAYVIKLNYEIIEKYNVKLYN